MQKHTSLDSWRDEIDVDGDIRLSFANEDLDLSEAVAGFLAGEI